MSLQCGIIGIKGVGKTTLFNCISTNRAETSKAGYNPGKSNVGIIHVPDGRLYELNKICPTEKITHATVEIVDIPGLTKGESNAFLNDIRNTDALIHVIRCFDNDSVPHIEGSVNPVRDIENVELELQFKDAESIAKKIVRVEKAGKAGDKDAKAAVEVLQKYKAQLEAFVSLRDLTIPESEMKILADLFLLTVKPVLYVCNVDEKSAITGNKYVDDVKKHLDGKPTEVLLVAAAIESEIAELEDPEDRKTFLQEIGFEEPGVNRLIRAAYSILDLISFFTVGPKDIRAWTINKGMNAQQSAGAIHSDIERGFIRAEVMKYNDYVTLGSEKACKEAGKLSIEGKQYIVNDGDIMFFRFNV